MKTLNPRERAFVAAFKGNATEAAAKAGYKFPGRLGSRILKRAHIKAAIEARDKAFVNRLGAKDAAEVEPIRTTRNGIINGLVLLAETAKSESARVAAYSKLADIFRLSAKSANDDDFSGWTDEELLHWATTGEYPERFRRTQKPGESDDGVVQPSTPPVN